MRGISTDEAIEWCKDHDVTFMYAHGVFTVNIGGRVLCSAGLVTALVGDRTFREDHNATWPGDRGDR